MKMVLGRLQFSILLSLNYTIRPADSYVIEKKGKACVQSLDQGNDTNPEKQKVTTQVFLIPK